MRTPSLLLAAGLVLASPLAAAARPTIAVLPFSADQRVVIASADGIFTGTVAGETDLLTSELVQQLVAARKFDVLERARVDDLVKEKQFQQSDYASPEEAPKIARLLGADYFVLGRLDAFSGESAEKTLPYGTQTYVEQEGRMALYLRVIDARTGKIVAAEKFSKEAKLRNPKKGEDVGRMLVADAAQALVGRITDTVFPLRVARIDGHTLYLNRGTDGSLKAGDMVSVYSQGDAITDQDTGETLGFTEHEVAQARVSDVQSRFTKAELTGDAAVKEGMLVRLLPAVKPTATELPPGPRW